MRNHRGILPYSYTIAEEKETDTSLVMKMSEADLILYNTFGRGKSTGARRKVACYLDRCFYIYQATGKDHMDVQRPPKVEAVVRVINMAFSISTGFEITLLNETTNTKQPVTTVPAKVFDLPVFAAVPCAFHLAYNKVTDSRGREVWDTVAAMYIKAANEANYYSMRNYYMETPAAMAKLYPEQEWRPDRYEQLDRY